MDQLQERVQREFVTTMARLMGDGPAVGQRIARLTMRLPPLKTFQAATIEELFFAGLIGNVQIDNIIPYILRMETAEYNLHMAGQALNVPSTPPQPSTLSTHSLSSTPSSSSLSTPVASNSGTDQTSAVLSQLSATSVNGSSQH
jgi:hypothetical protein